MRKSLPSSLNTSALIKALLCPLDDLILKRLAQIAEEITVSCDAHDQILILFRIILGVDQCLLIYDIELDMMSTKVLPRLQRRPE